MKRPAWLDSRISFCGDTPDHFRPDAPVLLSIHRLDSQKVWKWGGEVDFIGNDSADCGAWAQIYNIADCCRGRYWNERCRHQDPASRGSWCQFNFKTARGAFRFTQQTLLFVEAMKAAGVGLLPHGGRDSLADLFMKAQNDFCLLELKAKCFAHTQED